MQKRMPSAQGDIGVCGLPAVGLLNALVGVQGLFYFECLKNLQELEIREGMSSAQGDIDGCAP